MNPSLTSASVIFWSRVICPISFFPRASAVLATDLASPVIESPRSRPAALNSQDKRFCAEDPSASVKFFIHDESIPCAYVAGLSVIAA